MRLLYIGLRGLAGSGKDTVGNFLNYILENYQLSKEECLEDFHNYPKRVFASDYKSKKVFKIAFADQLKSICSTIFNVPVEAFYNGNKSNAWVCINKGFEYTENKPDDDNIITAEDYYSGVRSNSKPLWMSLREIMVYVGTYMLQKDINPKIFVNIVENIIKQEYNYNNVDLKYVICTDVRFEHEFDYIHSKFGLVLNIVNDRVSTPLNNIAEKSLDNSNEYDYIITNNGSYDDLFKEIYDLVHNNAEFENITVEPATRSFDANTYFRKYDDGLYQLCTNSSINRMVKDFGDIDMIDPAGGPEIRVGEVIPGTYLKVNSIEMDDKMLFWIKATNIE